MTTLTRRPHIGRTATRSPWPYLAALWSTLLYIPIHVYWAVGGTWGLPGSVAPHGGRSPSQATESAMRLANGAVCVLLLVGAGILLALARSPGRRARIALLIPMWIGSVVCVSHGVYGFVTKSLYVAGVHGAVDFPAMPGVDAATAAAANHASAVLDLAVFEPYFLIEGVLLALATRLFASTATARRRWTVAIVAGTLLIDVFGALLSLFHLRFAVS